MRGTSCLVAVASIALLFLLFFWTHAAALPAQIGVFRPSTGQWYFDYSGNRAWDRCGPDGCPGQFGASTDLPITGDWSGNGVPKLGVFRPADGRWYLDLNGNSFWDGCGTDGCFGPFGAPEDRPVIGDWEGTGAFRFGVFRPTTGQWFFDLNGNGAWDGCGTDGCSGPFGAPEDLPVAGDMDGDTVAEFGVFRPSTGMWYFDLDHSGSWSGCGADGCLGPFGAPGDQPAMTDINGDGQLEFGVFRPSTSQWYFDLDHNGAWSGCGADSCLGGFGGPGDLPVVGVWDRSAGPGDPLNYFPVTQGSSWTYQGTYSDSDGFYFNYQNIATVSGTKLIDGVTTTVVSISNPGGDGPFEEYLLKDGRGITNWGNNDPADTITPLVAAYQEIIFPMWTGASFKQFELGGVDLGEDLDGDLVNERVSMSSQIAVAGFENVSVPAGFFSNCAKVVNTLTIFGSLTGLPSLTFSGTATETTWYAPGTGPVKITTYLLLTTSNGMSYSSATQEVLMSYHIPVPPPPPVPPTVLGDPVQVGEGIAPKLAVSSNGEAVCVWVNQSSIWASRYIPGETWEIPVMIGNHGIATRDLALAIDLDGYATAVWIEQDKIWSNRYTPGVGWGVEENIDETLGWDSAPAIAVDSSGNMILVWGANEDGSVSLWSRRYEPGAGWTIATRIEPVGGRADSVRLAVDAAGNAVAVWFDRGVDFTYNDVWTCRYVSGAGWGTPELIEDNTSAVTTGELAIDINPDGIAVVVWPQMSGLYKSLWANRYVPGVGWGTAELIEGNPNDTWFVDVAVAPDGSTIAFWEQMTDTGWHRWVNRYVTNSGWETAAMIEDNPINAEEGQIVIDQNGNATVVWHQGYDGTTLWSKRYTPGAGWSTQQRIELSSAAVSSGLQVDVDAGGNIIVVWPVAGITTDDGTIWANRF